MKPIAPNADAIETPDVSAVANWYGSSRSVAERIGEEIGDRSLAIVPFAGGMAELQHIRTRKLVVNDLHRHVINLADTIADPVRGPKLYRRLRRAVFHPDALAAAQAFCQAIQQEGNGADGLFAPPRRVVDVDEWAYHYAIATWMGRGGRSGRKDEFGGALPVRYSTSGGGSAQRFHNWVRGIPAWRQVFRRFEACEFTVEDAFGLLARCAEFDDRLVIYVDSPWPDAGDFYAHPFGIEQHRRLATSLSRFKNGAFDVGTRVVVRFADHPVVRELYPEGPAWTWVRYRNRGQKNGKFDEVLIINGPSYTAGRAA